MKRSTKRDENGWYLTNDEIYSDWGVPEKFHGKGIDRLAAYEDTGLEPEEISGQKGWIKVEERLPLPAPPAEEAQK